jgi:hypothetical protein
MTSTIKVDTISENTSANGVAIDGVTLKDGGIAATAASTITTSDNATQLTLKSTDADAAVGPVLTLHRESSSPADDDIIGRINFIGEDSGGTDTTYGRIETVIMQESNGSEDATMEFRIMKGGTERNVLELDRSAVIINEDSQDIDFRVESNGNTSMLHVDAGNDRVGIGTGSPSTQLHVANTGGVELRLDADTDNSGQEDCFIKFLTDGGGQIGIVGMDNNNSSTLFSGNTENAMVFGCVSNLPAVFATNNTERMQITADGKTGIGETAPDCDAGGLTLNQGANDLNILTFKNSDVAHGMTSIAETDTYATIEKTSGDEGGFFLETFSEGITNLMLFACSTSEQSTRSTSATGPVEIRGKLKSGTNAAAMGSDANILIIRNHSTTRFIFDSDGDFHADSSSTTFDEYDDAQLARTFDISHGRGVIESKFDKFISYNHEKLAQLKLVGREEDGTPNHFINVSGMQRLHNGAIWQQYEKHQKLASAFYKLAEKTIGKEEADKLLTEEEIQLLN